MDFGLGEVTAGVLLGMILLAAAVAVIVTAGHRRRRKQVLQMQERLLAGLCHELRTPLNAIAGAVPLLEFGSPPARHRAVEVLQRNVRVQSTLIDELLGLAEVLTQATGPRLSPVNVGNLLGSVVARLRIFAQQRRVRLQFVPPDDDRLVIADRRRIAQMFGYLLSHAIRHAKAGSTVVVTVQMPPGRLEVELLTESPPANRWSSLIGTLHVSLPDAVVDERALGLSVVRELLARQGGLLSVTERANEVSWRVTMPTRAAPTLPAEAWSERPAS